MQFQNSPLKWLGSKQKVLPQLFELEQFKNVSKYDAFVEPFVGGGNVFLNVDHDNIIISDYNADLINFYYQIKNNFNCVLSMLKVFFSNIEKDEYYLNRQMFRELPQNETKAALFLYLNKVGFRGLCRYSKKTGFNVAFGHYKSVYFPENELIELHKKLQNVTIHHCGYHETFSNYLTLDKNNLGYCDPPYFETFTKYNADDFNIDDQNDLNDFASASLSDIIVSNSLESKEIYTPISTIDIDVTRGMSNGKGKGVRNITETLLIFN